MVDIGEAKDYEKAVKVLNDYFILKLKEDKIKCVSRKSDKKFYVYGSK